MTEPRFVPLRAGLLILGLQFLLLSFRLGDIPLLGPDEPRYARVAVEMARSNEWTTPTLAGAPWLEKPVLYYWLAGAAFRAFGETEFAARLPASLAALALTGVAGVVASRIFGATAGIVAMLAAALQPLTFAYGRAATMDMLVAACISAACALFALRRLGVAGAGAVPAAWAAMALGTLAKGPIGAGIPLLFVGTWAAAERRFAWREAVSASGVALFLAIAGPWHVAAWLENGWPFVEVFFLNHNLQRFTSTIHNHPGPPYYYLPVLLTGLFPFVGLSVGGLLARDRSPARRGLLLWLAVPLLLFSAAGSKLPGYIVPCVAPLAVFAGAFVSASGSVAVFRMLTLLLGAALGGAAAWGRWSDAWWSDAALAPAVWAVAGALALGLVAAPPRQIARSAMVTGAGLLLLLAWTAPGVLASRESGRSLFVPAHGRPVVAVTAWRTAWMSGYFYNDGRVREAASVDELLSSGELRELVLCGPPSCRELRVRAGLRAMVLARGPRDTELLRLALPPNTTPGPDRN